MRYPRGLIIPLAALVGFFATPALIMPSATEFRRATGSLPDGTGYGSAAIFGIFLGAIVGYIVRTVLDHSIWWSSDKSEDDRAPSPLRRGIVSRYRGFNTYMEFERGFHGWLVLFFVTSCIAACVRVLGLFQTGGELRLAIAARGVSLLLIVTAVLLIRAAMAVATIVGLVMFAKGDGRTPTFWASLYIASVASSGAILALRAFEDMLVNGDAFLAALWGRVHAAELWGVAVCVAWILYWMRSKRVRLTFGCNAFSALPSSTIESVALGT